MAEGSEENRCGNGASFWRETLEDWRRIGLKQSKYQPQHGLTKNAFTYWKVKLLGSARSEAKLVAVPTVAVGQGVGGGVKLDADAHWPRRGQIRRGQLPPARRPEPSAGRP